ncbi:MAG: hypothetical protein RL417_444 [Pseudomonadota bacterium]|jgi:hypothetical protein
MHNPLSRPGIDPELPANPAPPAEVSQSLAAAGIALTRGDLKSALRSLRSTELSVEVLRSDRELCCAAEAGLFAAQKRGDIVDAERIARILLPESPICLARNSANLISPTAALRRPRAEIAERICDDVIQRCREPSAFSKSYWNRIPYFSTNLEHADIPLLHTFELYVQPSTVELLAPRQSVALSADSYVRPPGLFPHFYLRSKIVVTSFPVEATDSQLRDSLIDTIYHEVCHVAQMTFRINHPTPESLAAIDNRALDLPPSIEQMFGYLVENPDEVGAYLSEAEFRARRLGTSLDDCITEFVQSYLRLTAATAQWTETESSIVRTCLSEFYRWSASTAQHS